MQRATHAIIVTAFIFCIGRRPALHNTHLHQQLLHRLKRVRLSISSGILPGEHQIGQAARQVPPLANPWEAAGMRIPEGTQIQPAMLLFCETSKRSQISQMGIPRAAAGGVGGARGKHSAPLCAARWRAALPRSSPVAPTDDSGLFFRCHLIQPSLQCKACTWKPGTFIL